MKVGVDTVDTTQISDSNLNLKKLIPLLTLACKVTHQICFLCILYYLIYRKVSLQIKIQICFPPFFLFL